MDFFTLAITVLLAELLAVMSPGPDFFLTIKNSLSQPKKIAIFTALGIGLGIGVHVTYSLLGLAVIISQSILIFNIIKFLGAGYLIWLGWKCLSSNQNKINFHQTKIPQLTSWQAFKMGFLTNALNPKATLFFLGLFTLVIDPQTPMWMQISLGGAMMFQTFLWFTLVSLLFSHQKIQHFYQTSRKYFDGFFGGLLILLGLKVALSSK